MSALIQLSLLYWIEPLTGDNYPAWKEKMCWILFEQDLWEHASVLEPWLGLTYFLFCLHFPYMDSLIVCPN